MFDLISWPNTLKCKSNGWFEILRCIRNTVDRVPDGWLYSYWKESCGSDLTPPTGVNQRATADVRTVNSVICIDHLVEVEREISMSRIAQYAYNIFVTLDRN